MNLQQPVWRTQWHRVNTTADCFAPERISPKGSWCFPRGWGSRDFCPAVEIIAQGPWEGEKRLLELCGSLWALPKPPAGQFLSCFNTICLPSSWSKSWPKLPKPSWVCTSPEQSQSTLPKIQQKMHQVHPIRALWKTSGGYFGEGTDSGAWYTEGFTVFLFKDYFAFLCHKIKTLWLIFYTECLQNVWANLVIYLFFKLDYFHSDSFVNSKNPRIFYKYKSPEWHCWLGLMHIEPLHCFKENLKKKTTKGSHKNTPKQPKTQQKCLPWNQQTFHRKHTMVLPARSRWNILF